MESLRNMQILWLKIKFDIKLKLIVVIIILLILLLNPMKLSLNSSSLVNALDSVAQTSTSPDGFMPVQTSSIVKRSLRKTSVNATCASKSEVRLVTPTKTLGGRGIKRQGRNAQKRTYH